MGEPIADIEARLADIEAAIKFVLTGGGSGQPAQATSRSGRAYNGLSLVDLYKIRRETKWELAQATGVLDPIPVRFKQPPGAGVTAYDPEHNYVGPAI